MKLFKIFKPPFRYDDWRQKVLDSENQMAIDIRGWGAFQNAFKNKDESIDFESAEKEQNRFGEWVAESLNKNVPTGENK